ncbi:MAG TPA: ankyrin repeat domain-containing protein, partial [Candidatus Acidoferrum sp.]|nr:ankyrin repeat domain-containing protein [Candidatus Acidoferrum sp.]
MKAKLIIWFVCLAAAGALAQTNGLTAALQQGLFEEEANRNLDAAIASYQSLAEQFDQDRQVAATAIFRLGECYRKLGRTNDAVVQYQRIIREFSDQTTLATLSRQNLAGINPAAQPHFQDRLVATITRVPQEATAATGTEPATKADELEAEAASLKAQMQQLENLDREKIRVVIQQSFPNPVLTKLMQDLTDAEQKLASLTNDYTPGNPQIVRVRAQIDAINGQIDSQVEGVIKGLQAKLDADLDAAKVIRDKSGAGPAAQPQPAAVVIDDEEQEIRRIQAMIQNSPDLINAPSDGGKPAPLGNAASKGQLRVASFLLANGADVNFKVNDWSPLFFAVANGHRAMVELLLAKGADVNTRDHFGKTPLQLAAENGFQSVAEALLAGKADINARDNDQETPLYLAARKGHVAMVTFLLDHHAEPDVPDKYGRTPLSLAAQAGHAGTLQKLLAGGASPDLADNVGQTPLSCAAQYGHLDSVKALLAAKANPNASRGLQPLPQAIHRNDLTMTKLLLDAGADANRVSPISWQFVVHGDVYGTSPRPNVSPLFLAICDHNTDAVRLLLRHQADPNDTNPDGVPVIFWAMDQPDVVKALLEAGANPNVKNGEGYSPLFLASDPETVRLLLAHHASPDDRCKGLTRLLQVATWPPGDAADNIAEALLQGGANVNATNEFGWTALHLAVSSGNQKLVELLLAHKADVNVRNNQGKTPLDLVNEPPSPRMGSSGGQTMPPRSRRTPGISPSTPQAQAVAPASLADLLRQHGALENLPDFSRIRITRQGVLKPLEVFRQGPNLTNHFTLLETVIRFYNQSTLTFPSDNITTYVSPYNVLTFPDFGQVIIHRPSRKPGGQGQEIKVSLLNSSNVLDCAKDVPVEFGDVIEIPERVHALNELLPDPVREMKSDLDSARFQERLKAITDRTANPTNPALVTPEEAAILRLAAMPQREAETKGAAEVAARRWACLQKTVQLV